MRLALAALAAIPMLAATPALASENYQPIRVDTGVIFLYGPADIAEYGFGAFVEPKYNVTDHLSVGVRIEGAATMAQSLAVGPDNIDLGIGAFTTYLAKADFYLTTASVRPFVGIGAGRYSIGGLRQSVSGTSVVQEAQVLEGWGFAPQVGLQLGGFRLAATYHFITGGDRFVVTQAIGGTPERSTMPTRYLAVELGGTFGGNRRAAPPPAVPLQ